MSKNYKLQFSQSLPLTSIELVGDNGSSIRVTNDTGIFNNDGNLSTLTINSFIGNPVDVSNIEFETIDNSTIYKILLTAETELTGLTLSLELLENDSVFQLFTSNQFFIETGIQQIITIRSPKHVVLPTEVDKTRLTKVKTAIVANEHLEMLDVISYLTGKTSIAHTGMNLLIDGKKYQDLIDAGIKSTDATKIMAVYNMTIDVGKVKRETAINLIKNNFNSLNDFNNWIMNLGLQSLTINSLSRLYDDMNVNDALESWLDAYNSGEG